MRPHLSLVAGVFVGILGLTPMSAYADVLLELVDLVREDEVVVNPDRDDEKNQEVIARVR